MAYPFGGNIVAGLGSTHLASAYGASAIAGSLYGGANYASGEGIGFNPLAEITPTPWMGAVYGAATGMPWPWQAMSAFKEGMMGPNPGRGFAESWSSPSGWRHTGKSQWTGSWNPKTWGWGPTGRKGSFAKRSAAEGNLKKRHFGGMLGWKTMLLGVHGGMWSKLSVGNVGLSTIELIGKTFQSFDPTWKSSTVGKMANARQLGLAGMFNMVDDVDAPGNLKQGWLYRLAGVDPDDAKYVKLGSKAASGMGDKAALKITDDIMKKGLQMTAASGMGRIFGMVGGAFSMWTWYSIIRDTTNIVAGIAGQGMGQAATQLYNWLGEVNQPEFGSGRIHHSMASGAASTERQRALRAAYSAKINPNNRMYGNEAAYHHSR